ncbi:hypothetical protein RVBP17_0510 [Pseudomonas phage sp. 30-3]|uniref:Structural protein n=1 Tax=Pseudomonas phage vB_PaeM_PA5oct TaxID=2163605 RepID=A0A4Y5JTF1_9CAUD|nr:virion structural protein [Pseudomonas phage vB_PaeM_PA5oct]WMI32089.1 hypothetical protein GBBBJNDB_00398 [Pseudomonas phage Callisto]WPK39127.1 virion structural protein [Pseudomonas phage Cassandra]WPK39639.1 virion structural protein [Pseudomonas phage Deifobo]WPK40160.1 virion structural protein [Pseudomonas phage Ettore]WPK40675.1 virion structural protein [Pseudomonas phage Paride]VOH56145.1 structural protein [Pseudomonas phage vB_PaeM_MIJ3]BDR25906.1 hypothetical protein RVBP16_3
MDSRAILKPKNALAANDLFGESNDQLVNILAPLKKTGGLIFPFRPIVTLAADAEYDESFHFTHTNYKYLAYVKSAPQPISVEAIFTSQTDVEARYTLAAMHFMRTVTKNYFGQTDLVRAGTPPPILSFNYLGTYMFKNVPVVVKNFSIILDNKVDYVPVRFNNISENTDVPTQLTMTITLEPQYNPQEVRQTFDLSKFRTGELLKNNKGFI